MATVATAMTTPFAILSRFRKMMNIKMNGRKSRALPRVKAAHDNVMAANIHNSHVFRFHERSNR